MRDVVPTLTSSQLAGGHSQCPQKQAAKRPPFLTPEHLSLGDSMRFGVTDYSINIQLLHQYSLSTCWVILRTNNTQTWSPASRSPQTEGSKTLNHYNTGATGLRGFPKEGHAGMPRGNSGTKGPQWAKTPCCPTWLLHRVLRGKKKQQGRRRA